MYTYEVPRVHCDYTATGHVCVYMYVLYIYEVPRVHCDYTATGAPRRLVQLGREGIYSKLRHRTLTEEEVGELASGRYAFINVWRSIDEDAPVMQQPLAVCDEHSVADKVRSFVVHSYKRPCSLSPLRALVSSKYSDEHQHRTASSTSCDSPTAPARTTRCSIQRRTSGTTTAGSARRSASSSRCSTRRPTGPASSSTPPSTTRRRPAARRRASQSRFAPSPSMTHRPWASRMLRG